MFHSINSFIENKLLLTFFIIGMFPLTIFLIYMIYLSQNKILQKSLNDEKIQIEKTEQIVQTNLTQLYNEIIFLSKLEIMDDIVTEDLDKRITTLLEKKANALHMDVVLYVVDKHGKLIASSQRDYAPSFQPQNMQGYQNKEKKLYFYSAIKASYNKQSQLGYLVLEYNLENLQLFFTTTPHIHTFLLSSTQLETIAPKINFAFNPHKTQVINEKYIVVYKKQKKFLEEWYLVYAVDKNVALAFLYDFLRFILYMVPLVILLIIFIAKKFSKKITIPILQLTSLTKSITKTKNFEATINLDTQDEIQQLSQSFNLMLQMTHNALQELKKENEIRLQRFIHLIETFNSIMQTKTTQECIEVSLEKLQTLVAKEHIHFQAQNNTGCIALEAMNYETGKKEVYGALCIDKQHLNNKDEKQFFESIGHMISLQLDRILLINNTLAISHAKSAFISNMSHELRTPLNAIIGSTQYLLSYEKLTDDQLEMIGNVESSAQYLLSMINDILDMAKIEAGKMDIHPQKVSPKELVDNVVTMLMPLLDEKDLSLYKNITVSNSLSIMTDPKIYQQICINLLSNSIKFTAKGSITLQLYKKENTIIFELIDTGIGISQENIKKLFEEFTQVENVMQKKHKGTGLGLSLSKKMAQLLDGDIILESHGESYGTKALFWIPL